MSKDKGTKEIKKIAGDKSKIKVLSDYQQSKKSSHVTVVDTAVKKK